MIQYLKKNKAAVNLEDTPFASGGEGSVYRIVNIPGYCAKIYFDSQLSKDKEEKINYLVNHHSNHQPNDKIIICWPTELIYNKSGKFVGFIMPLSFPKSIQLYEIVTAKISTKLDDSWKKKFNRNTLSGIQNRLKICVNIAIAMHTLHQTKQYVLVDFKPQNILINLEGKVSIIDIDSIQISEGSQILHYAKVATPEYAPKESEKLNPANDLIFESWDRFSLAVVFYEILFGIHPYTATASGQYDNISTIDEKIRKNLFVHGSKKNYLIVIPKPHIKYDTLPTSIRNLFVRAFETGTMYPMIRPSAEEWGKIIIEELSKSNINVQNPSPIVSPIVKPSKVVEQVKILSNPLGASVFYNSQELGTTPCFLDRDEYLNKILKVTYDDRFTTIFIDVTENEFYAHFPVINASNNKSQTQSAPQSGYNFWEKLMFVVSFIVVVFILINVFGIDESIKEAPIYTTDTTEVAIDRAIPIPAPIDVEAPLPTTDSTVVSSDATATTDTTSAVASNNYTAEEVCNIFLLALDKSDCETAWKVTFNPIWEQKGKDWFCSTQAYGGVNKVKFISVYERQNDGINAVFSVRYAAEDPYNGNGYYVQNFTLRKDNGNWYIVKVTNIR